MPPPRLASSIPVPKKPRVTPSTISEAVVQHADREAVPPKSIFRQTSPSISDASVQHAAREAVPPKPPSRVPWACGNTKVVAKEEPMQRFLQKLVANASKKPLSAEQRLAAQARGLLPVEPRQGAELAWLSHAESAAAPASQVASIADKPPSQTPAGEQGRVSARVQWRSSSDLQATCTYTLEPDELRVKRARLEEIELCKSSSDEDDESTTKACPPSPPRVPRPPLSPPPSPSSIVEDEIDQVEEPSSPPPPPPSPGAERRSRPRSTKGVTRVVVFFSGPQDDGLVRILRGAGIEVDAFDILQDREGQDVTKNSVLNPVLHRIASHYYDFVFIATPCCSFSILKAMRTLLDPDMSNEELTPFEQAYFKKHNRLCDVSATIASFAHKAGIPFVVENPAPRHDRDSPAFWAKFSHLASLFDMPSFKSLIKSTGAKLTIFSQCMFKGRFQKMTGFLCSPRISSLVQHLFGTKICNHSHHEELAMGEDEHGESLAAQAAAYPPEMNMAILHLIQESIAASVVSIGNSIHLGSADPHGVDGAHAEASPTSWAPSGSLRQLEPELDSVLLEEPLPHVNVVPRTKEEHPPPQPASVPGPFTTEELIPSKVYDETVSFGKQVVKLLRRAKRGKDGWRIARDMRPESKTWTEEEALNPCGRGWVWRFNKDDNLWHAVTPSSSPEKPPQSSVSATRFDELAKKTGLTDEQLISWIWHGFPGATKLKVFAQLAAPHVGALKHASDLEECNQKEIKAGFVSSGFEFPEYWPAVVDPMNIVVQHHRARLCIDKSMIIGEQSYNSTIDLDRDEHDRRVTLVRVWQFCRGAAILDAACRRSVDAYVTLSKFDLKAFFRQHGKQELFVYQSSRCLESLFGSDFRVNFGERDAPEANLKACPSGEHSTRASPSVFAQASAESYPQAMQAMTTCAPLRRHEVNWLVLIALLLVYIVPRTHDAVDGPRLLTPDERRLPNILKVMSPSSGFVEWGAAIGALGQCGTAPHVLSPQRVLLQTAGGALLPTLAYGFERGGLLRTCFRDAMHFGNNSWEFDGLLEWVMLLFAAIDFGYCVASYWGACHHFWRAVSVVGSPLYLVEDASRLRTLDARELPTLRRLDDGVVAVVAVLDSTAEVHLNKFFSHVRQISHPYHVAGLPLPRDTVDTLCAQAARDLLCLECATTTMDMVVVVVDAKLRRPLAEWCTTSLSFDSTGRVAVKAVEPRLLGSTEECLAVALQAAALLEVLEFAPCPQLTRGQALVRHHLYGPHLCDTIRMHHELETECMTPDERQADARRAPVVPTVLHMFDERVRVRHGLDLGCHFSSGEPSVATLSSSHVPLCVDVHTGAVDELDELRARGRRPLPHPLLCDSRRNRSLWYRQHRRSGGTHVGHQTAQEPGGALQGPRQASERGRVPGGRRGPLDDHAAEDHHLRGDGAPARPTVGHLASHLLGDAV